MKEEKRVRRRGREVGRISLTKRGMELSQGVFPCESTTSIYMVAVEKETGGTRKKVLRRRGERNDN